MSHPWLIVTNNTKALFSQLKNVPLRMDTNLKVASPKEDSTFALYDVYNPGFGLGGEMKVNKWGIWNGTLYSNESESHYERRKDMKVLTLRVATVLLQKEYRGTFEENMKDSRYKHIDTMSKFHYAFFLYLQEIHGFNYTVRIEDAWFGNYQNGTDAGVGKLLYNKQIDLTCTGASLRPLRIACYDYLMPSYHFRPSYIFRNPDSYDVISDQFFKPFSIAVWSVAGIIALVLCTSLKLFHQWTSRRARYSWTTVLLLTLAPVVNQGSAICPTSHGSRTVFASLLLMSMLLYNYYTSSVISSLLNQKPKMIETLDEMAHSKLGIGIEDTPYTRTWYAIINDSDVQYIYKRVLLPDGKLNTMDPHTGIAKVRQGRFAYHTQLDTGYPIIARTFSQKEICDIVSINMIPKTRAGMLAQKHSQYYDLFQITLQKVHQSGLARRVSSIWQSDKPVCLSGTQVKAVGGDQTFIAFLLWMIGIALAVFLMLVEICWQRCRLDEKIDKSWIKTIF